LDRLFACLFAFLSSFSSWNNHSPTHAWNIRDIEITAWAEWDGARKSAKENVSGFHLWTVDHVFHIYLGEVRRLSGRGREDGGGGERERGGGGGRKIMKLLS
jgi:hypothetical protein